MRNCALGRVIQYAAAYPLKHYRLWNTWSPGPGFAKGFAEAFAVLARRSFSGGGKPGEDGGV
jgi:hypothetical protein